MKTMAKRRKELLRRGGRHAEAHLRLELLEEKIELIRLQQRELIRNDIRAGRRTRLSGDGYHGERDSEEVAGKYLDPV